MWHILHILFALFNTNCDKCLNREKQYAKELERWMGF